MEERFIWNTPHNKGMQADALPRAADARRYAFIRKIMRYLIISLSFMLILGCGAMQHGALIRAYKAIDNDDCNTAYRMLSNAEKYSKPTPELQAEISYLRCICLEKEKRYDEALALLLYIAKEFPNTQYGYRAILLINRIKSLPGEDQQKINQPEERKLNL
jgi:hypothetical protein